MKITLSIAVFITLALPLSASAPAQTGYAPFDRQPIEHLGLEECKYWPSITGPASSVQTAKVVWLYGYVEGIRWAYSVYLKPDKPIPLPIALNLTELAGRVDDYCHDHPSAFIADAVTEVAKQVNPSPLTQ